MLATTLGVTLLSQFALSPIMMAVFFGAVLGSLPSLPADPTLTALAVATGWAVSTTFSPFASGVIFLSRVSGHGGAKLTWNWNGPFSVIFRDRLGGGLLGDDRRNLSQGWVNHPPYVTHAVLRLPTDP